MFQVWWVISTRKSDCVTTTNSRLLRMNHKLEEIRWPAHGIRSHVSSRGCMRQTADEFILLDRGWNQIDFCLDSQKTSKICKSPHLMIWICISHVNHQYRFRQPWWLRVPMRIATNTYRKSEPLSNICSNQFPSSINLIYYSITGATLQRVSLFVRPHSSIPFQCWSKRNLWMGASEITVTPSMSAQWFHNWDWSFARIQILQPTGSTRIREISEKLSSASRSPFHDDSVKAQSPSNQQPVSISTRTAHSPRYMVNRRFIPFDWLSAAVELPNMPVFSFDELFRSKSWFLPVRLLIQPQAHSQLIMYLSCNPVRVWYKGNHPMHSKSLSLPIISSSTIHHPLLSWRLSSPCSG